MRSSIKFGISIGVIAVVVVSVFVLFPMIFQATNPPEKQIDYTKRSIEVDESGSFTPYLTIIATGVDKTRTQNLFNGASGYGAWLITMSEDQMIATLKISTLYCVNLTSHVIWGTSGLNPNAPTSVIIFKTNGQWWILPIVVNGNNFEGFVHSAIML